MTFTVTTSNQDRNFRVQIDPSAGADEQVKAVKALVDQAKSSRVYLSSKNDYELRLIQRRGNTYLELHTRDFISRSGSFLKGVLTGSRGRRTEEREAARAAAARFHAGLIASKSAHAAGLSTLREHLRIGNGKDPLAGTVLDEDKAAVERDVKSAMQKLRAYFNSNENAMAKLEHAPARDQLIYAPGKKLLGKDIPDMLGDWNEDWSMENTCGFMLDMGLVATRNPTDKPTLGYVRPDLFADGEGSFLDEQVGESKAAAKLGQLQHSQWVNEFVPAGSQVQSGASATTLRLLELLSRVDGITPLEIEAVMNGVSKYWAGSAIKQMKGEFHTTAEVWASYNHFLESQRIPRELKALAPQSKRLIDHMSSNPEGLERLQQIHANWRQAKAEGHPAEGEDLVRGQLSGIEAELPIRDAVKLHLSTQSARLVSMAPDNAEVNALLEVIRREMTQRRQALQSPVSPLVKEALQELRTHLPGRTLIEFEYPILKERIDMLPASEDERLEQMAKTWTELNRSDSKAAVINLLLQLSAYHTNLPMREAVIFLTPPGSTDALDMLKKVPAQGYDDKLTAVFNALKNTYWLNWPNNPRVNKPMQDLFISLPAQTRLWVKYPEHRQQLERMEAQVVPAESYREILRHAQLLENQDLDPTAYIGKALSDLEKTRVAAAEAK